MATWQYTKGLHDLLTPILSFGPAGEQLDQSL
jgi:hypothetical protein